MQLYARISGDGPTPYIAGFSAKKLAQKQAWAQQNGYGFHLLNHVAAPAAQGISTPLSKQDADRQVMKSRKYVPLKKNKIPTPGEPTKAVAPPKQPKKAATARTKRAKATLIKPEKPPKLPKPEPPARCGWGKHPNSHICKEKAAVNLTRGTYHDSVQDAANAIGGQKSGVCRQIRGLRRIYYGCQFRYATHEEVSAKQVITL